MTALLLRIVIIALPLAAGIAAAFYVGKFKKLRWFRPLLQLLTAVGVTAVLLLGFLNLYVIVGFGTQEDIVRSVPAAGMKIALTFDDGPSPIFTPLILDILAEYDVPAAFFVVGDHVEKYPEVAARIVADGHEIGNHTFNHINVPTASLNRLTAQLALTNAAIWNATGVIPDYVRPPRGLFDSRFRSLAQLMDMKIVLWSVSSQDWLPGRSSDDIVRRVLQRAQGGDIVLFHDSGALIRSEGASRLPTVKALPHIIEGLLALDFEIVPLSRLLAAADDQEP